MHHPFTRASRVVEGLAVLFGAYLALLPAAQIHMVWPGRRGEAPTTGKGLLLLPVIIIIVIEWRLWRARRHPDVAIDAQDWLATGGCLALMGLLVLEQFTR